MSNRPGSDGKTVKGNAQMSMANNRDSDKKKQQLITMGKAKGFLTYDEVNDAMPDEIVSSDQIDDWLSTLGDEGIEVVDGQGPGGAVKVATARVTPKLPEVIEEDSEEATAETEEKETEKEEEEDYEGYSKTNDPVRMYLRKMGSV